MQRSIVLADLAVAQIRSGEPEAGVHSLQRSAAIVSVTRGRVALQRIHQARRTLAPWASEEFVVELDERLLASVCR